MTRSAALARPRSRSAAAPGGVVLDPVGALALAVLVVALTLGAKLALGPIVDERPFLLLNAAVLASAWLGGARAGLAAIVLSVAGAAFLFLPPPGFAVGNPADLWALALFVGEALFITGVCETARDARAAAARARAEAVHSSAQRERAEQAARHVESGLAALSRLGSALGAELEPRQGALLAAQGAASVTGAHWALLSFRRAGAAQEDVREAVGAPDLAAELKVDVERLSRLAGDGVHRIADVRHDAALAPLAGSRQPMRSLLLARVEGRSGCGLLLAAHPEPGAFDERHELLLGVLAAQAAAALDNAHHHADAQQAVADAQAAGRMKDEFLSTLSHELRTPLNAIMGWAHLLQGRKLGPDDTHRAVETIVRNASLQQGMIAELLDMSSLLNGRLRLHADPVDLRRVVEDAVATANGYARAKNVELQLAAPDAAVVVMGDATRLQQVVWSLLSNAVKFTPPGGRVGVTLSRGKGRAEVAVTDSGAGMEREFLSRVFSRFARSDASSTRPTRGLGLGLAVARGLVELHDGEISAESPGPGLGSTFTVRLPLSEHALPAEPPPPLAGPARRGDAA